MLNLNYAAQLGTIPAQSGTRQVHLLRLPADQSSMMEIMNLRVLEHDRLEDYGSADVPTLTPQELARSFCGPSYDIAMLLSSTSLVRRRS